MFVSVLRSVSLQLYGRRAAWEDPAAWVIDTYPWSATPTPSEWPPLLQLRPEDVGFDGYSVPREGVRKEPLQSDSDADPLVSERSVMCVRRFMHRQLLSLIAVTYILQMHLEQRQTRTCFHKCLENSLANKSRLHL